ncbi:MAG: tRNA pseudouridine(38-40) synthase TruA, partial [Nitrospirota bacterium]
HKRSPDSVTDILQAKDRRAAGETAPPQGLYLLHVWY